MSQFPCDDLAKALYPSMAQPVRTEMYPSSADANPVSEEQRAVDLKWRDALESCSTANEIVATGATKEIMAGLVARKAIPAMSIKRLRNLLRS